MTEKQGHFEKGIWIENRLPPSPQADNEAIEKRLSEATKAVITSIDNVMVVTHDLITTDEGRHFIEKSLREEERQIQLSLEAIISHAKAEVERTKARLEREAAELERKVKR